MATVAVGRPLSGSAAGLVRALGVALPGLRDDPVGLVVHQREAVGGEVVAQLADAVLVEAEDALAVVLAGAKEGGGPRVVAVVAVELHRVEVLGGGAVVGVVGAAQHGHGAGSLLWEPGCRRSAGGRTALGQPGGVRCPARC